MHHVGTITKTDRILEFHAQCSCGTAGDFTTKDMAENYLRSHFSKQTGISTSELNDYSHKPAPTEITPAAESKK